MTRTDKELMPIIKEIIYDGLGAQGMENITSYLYGDEMARIMWKTTTRADICSLSGEQVK